MTVEEKRDSIVTSSLMLVLRRTPTPQDYSFTELKVTTKGLVVKYKNRVIKRFKKK